MICLRRIGVEPQFSAGSPGFHGNRGSTPIFSCVVLAVCSMALAPVPALAEEAPLLSDPGFELELQADEGGWRTFEIGQFSGKHARGGSQSMFNGAFSRTVAHQPYFVGMVSGSYQELDAEPGSRWRLTGYGMTPVKLKGTPAFGIVQLSFFDADGNDLGTTETQGDETTKAKTSNEISSRAPAGEWILLDTGIATAPAQTATVQAFTLYVDYSGSNTSQGVYFDDLSLCAVVDEGTDDSTAEACK